MGRLRPGKVILLKYIIESRFKTKSVTKTTLAMCPIREIDENLG